MVIVELLQQRYATIDADRRYIAGISMGAFGVWDATERWPGYFAAAVPVAGAGSPALASELRATAVWAFHGAADSGVPPSGSKDMVLAIRAAGGRACYTLYPGAPHAIWTLVFGLAGNASNPLYPWLFAQRRLDPAASSWHC
jgi:predicted peptidase